METVNRFAIGFESKEAGKLLSLAAFEEMIDFDQKLNALTVDGGLRFKDLCVTFYDPDKNKNVSKVEKTLFPVNDLFIYTVQFCKTDGAKPIDAVYDLETDSYDLSKYKTDAELLVQI